MIAHIFGNRFHIGRMKIESMTLLIKSEKPPAGFTDSEPAGGYFFISLKKLIDDKDRKKK